MNELLEKFRLEMILAVLGLILVGIGVGWWRMGMGRQETVEIISAADADTASKLSGGRVVVDVGGAVARSGVYEMEIGKRVGDAVDKAGGLTAEADFEWVEKYLNRSDVIKDGMKIYIPRVKEPESERVRVAGNESLQVNINTAGQAELEALPGVGPVTAGKIARDRPYGRVDELVERKIVSQKVWEQIKDQVSVW